MSLFKSIAAFGGFTLISRITGFVRDMVLANILGAGAVSDAFLSPSNSPISSAVFSGEGAFTTAFVPMLSQKLAVGERENGNQIRRTGHFRTGIFSDSVHYTDGNFHAGGCRRFSARIRRKRRQG